MAKKTAFEQDLLRALSKKRIVPSENDNGAKLLRVGIIVADEDEYIGLTQYRQYGMKADAEYYHHYPCVKFEYIEGQRVIHADFVLSGLGLSNAAGAAGMMIADGYDCLLNTGFSGALSGLIQGDTVVCEQVAEHDFDLSFFGYEPGQKKKGTSCFYQADPALTAHFLHYIPGSHPGVAVSGNGFVTDSAKKHWIRDTFGATCCDMESAGIASVCARNKTPFAVIRRISDNADDTARNEYSDYIHTTEHVVPIFDCIMTAIVAMTREDALWENASPAQLNFPG